jgi:hypothetical protein
MDTETYQRMTFEECCRAMEITKQIVDEEEKEIVKQKNIWMNNFKSLLLYAINGTEDKKIDSKELGELWLFYLDGVHIRHIFKKLTQVQVQQLLNQQNVLEELLGDDCTEITKSGVFLYQTAYYLTMSKLKLEESLIRYSNVYNDDDPIIWLKNNNNSWNNPIHNKDLERKIQSLCNLWGKIYKVSSLALDPIFQT